MIFPSWQETFVALHKAQTCEELWGVLLVDHGIRTSSAWEEPYILFSRFHRDDSDNAAVTALLLCTDTRWRTAAHRLIRRLADSDMLGNAALDDLASRFLDSEVTVLAVSGPDEGSAINAISYASREVVVHRPVWPPLRRWAAARQVRRDPVRWRDLLDLARSAPSDHATAIAAGVMEAADLIPASARPEALEQGMEWGSGTVRLAALPGYGQLHGGEAARRRASQDPSAKVRKWADQSSGRDAQPQATIESNARRSQPSLFDAPLPKE